MVCHRRNWVVQFKPGNFSTCYAPHPGRPKTVTTPEIIDQIRELILEDRRAGFRLNQYLSNWASHVSGMGPSFIKLWTCGTSLRSGSRNAWTRIKNVNGASGMSKFRNFFGAIQMIFCRAWLVAMDETWLCHYDPETKQQSMEWRHSGSSRPKKFRVQKFAGKVLASIFFRLRRHPPHWLYSKGSNYQRRVLLTSAGENEGNLKEKRRGKVTKGVLFLHENAPAHRALATLKKLAYLGFQCLDHPPYSPDLAPSDYHLFPGLKKTIERSPFFVRRGGHCCRGDLVGRTNFWIFLSGLQRLEQGAKSALSFVGSMLKISRVWSL